MKLNPIKTMLDRWDNEKRNNIVIGGIMLGLIIALILAIIFLR